MKTAYYVTVSHLWHALKGAKKQNIAAFCVHMHTTYLPCHEVILIEVLIMVILYEHINITENIAWCTAIYKKDVISPRNKNIAYLIRKPMNTHKAWLTENGSPPYLYIKTDRQDIFFIFFNQSCLRMLVTVSWIRKCIALRGGQLHYLKCFVSAMNISQ